MFSISDSLFFDFYFLGIPFKYTPPGLFLSENKTFFQGLFSRHVSISRYVFFSAIDFSLYAVNFKGTLSGLRQFLATERHLKMMKNVFLFHLKSFFHYQHI